jgi:hypothetical protein
MGDRKPRWLLLIHQIPPRPNYLRVKIGRRLQKVGAVAVKNSVYALPNSDQAQELLAWVAREITEGGGDTSLCESSFVGEKSDAAVEELFNQARTKDLDGLAEEAREIKRGLGRKRRLDEDARSNLASAIARLRKRLSEILELDFFGAPGRETLDALLTELGARLESPAAGADTAAESTRPAVGTGSVWVTRKGVHVDRIASAWLIRRFIDPEAIFKFVSAKGYVAAAGELRFDMFEAEYTHQGDRCTFEVLLQRFAIDDAALVSIAEVVHDIDVRDEKFGRPEVAGVERLIAGIALTQAEDEARLALGARVLDALYESWKRRKT